MKNLLIFRLFIIGMVMVQFAQAQTADEVIDKFINSQGGKEKLLALNSVRMEGGINIQGTDVSLLITKLNNVGFRTDIEVMGTSNYQIVTPAKGISFMPVQGMASPTDMAADQFRESQVLLDIQSPLLNYKEKGNTIELLGTEKIDGEDNYKLKVTYKNGIVNIYYINSASNRLSKISGKRTMNGQEMDVSTTFSNYKQTTDGYWFAYTTKNMQGEVNFDKIEANIKVDESIFK